MWWSKSSQHHVTANEFCTGQCCQDNGCVDKSVIVETWAIVYFFLCKWREKIIWFCFKIQFFRLALYCNLVIFEMKWHLVIDEILWFMVIYWFIMFKRRCWAKVPIWPNINIFLIFLTHKFVSKYAIFTLLVTKGQIYATFQQ